jgi:hypothetical protein
MPGTWTTTRVSPWAIHTFTAPEDGWLVNSHIIELPSTAVRYRRAVRNPLPPGEPRAARRNIENDQQST